MAANANIGILIPGSFAGAPPTLREFTAFFRRADDLGLHSLWVIDRIFHHNHVLDPMTLLTCAAAVTSRIRVGTSVLLFVLRNPILIAKTTATLDHLSGGRLTLGVSLGGRDNEFEPLGVSMKQRVSRLRENLTVMRKLWTDHVVWTRQYIVSAVSELPDTQAAAERLLGWLYAVPSGISASQFTRWHLDHHAELGSSEDDPKRHHLSPKRNARWYKALYCTPALFPIYFRAARRESATYPEALRRQIAFERRVAIAAHLAAVGLLWWAFGGAAALRRTAGIGPRRIVDQAAADLVRAGSRDRAAARSIPRAARRRLTRRRRRRQGQRRPASGVCSWLLLGSPKIREAAPGRSRSGLHGVFSRMEHACSTVTWRA